MKHRHFYVALGIPRGADSEAITLAYRRLVVRYQDELDEPSTPDDASSTQGAFAVLRSYSERRHKALMEEAASAMPNQQGEVDRFFGGFVPEALVTHKARQAGKDLYVELRLSEAEARSGGLYAVHIPVLRPCPRCTDADEPARIACPACKGSGRITSDHRVDVAVPPGVRHDQFARLAMEDVGLEETDLLVRVLVSSR